MGSSRFLSANTPGGLLSTIAGMLTAHEVLIVQAIENGTYFVFNEVPTGTIDGNNKTFTLANTPNPAGKAEIFLNGQKLQGGGGDYSITNATITFNTAPAPGSIMLSNYIVTP